MKKAILLATLFMVSVVFIGCETISGFGRDLENTGTAITDTIEGI